MTPDAAARSILGEDARNPYKGQKKQVMQEVLSELVSKMQPEQVASLLDLHHGHGNMNVRGAIRGRDMSGEERQRFAAAMSRLDPKKTRFPAMHRHLAETRKVS
jgi:hypothetical protein